MQFINSAYRHSIYIHRVKFSPDNDLLLKIYQCQKCNRVFRHEADREEHGRGDSSHQDYREYELETFLTRFLVA